MRSPPARVAGIALLLLPLLPAACSSLPGASVPATAPLPTRFESWTLFQVSAQYVYAAEADEAQAAGVLALAAAADFRARTGRDPSPRQIVVADHEGVWPGGDPCLRLELARAASDDLPADCAELLAESGKQGVEPRDIVGLASFAVPVSRLVAEFGWPEGSAAAWDWAIFLPTRDCVDGAMERVLGASMEKELSFVERLLAEPLLPFVREAAVDTLLDMQKVRLFELHAAAQDGWTDEQRARLVQEYEDGFERDADKR